MNIIGSFNNGFIISANTDEIAHIAGYSYASMDEVRGKLYVGASITVARAWNRMESIRTAPSRLRTVAEALRETAKKLEENAEIIEQV